MSIVSDSLAALDEGRALLAEAGLNPFSVTLRVIRWAGVRPGQGASTVTDTPITVARGQNPAVSLVSSKDLVAGGSYKSARYDVTVTPSYTGGGTSLDQIEPPAVTGESREVFYILRGPGLPAAGMLCKKVGDRFDSPFRLVITIEPTGKTADT